MTSSVEKSKAITAAERNKLIILIGIVCLLNLVIALSVEPAPARHLDGSVASKEEVRSAALMTLLVTFTLVGALLGLVVAAFPFRGLRYPIRYLRAFLLSLLFLHAVWLAGNVIGMIMCPSQLFVFGRPIGLSSRSQDRLNNDPIPEPETGCGRSSPASSWRTGSGR